MTSALATILMLATLVVSVLSLFYLIQRRKRNGDDDDHNGKRKKGEKVYPLPYWAFPYEEFEEFAEDVCDREFQGKCRQECLNGSTRLCQNCLVTCEKQGYRLA